VCRLNSQVLRRVFTGAIQKDQRAAGGDKLAQCRGAGFTEAATIFLGHARCVAAVDDASRLIRKHDRIEAVMQPSRLDIGVVYAGVGEAELLEQPSRPTFVHARLKALVQADTRTRDLGCAISWRPQAEVPADWVTKHLAATLPISIDC